jgi:hypothetical protein
MFARALPVLMTTLQLEDAAAGFLDPFRAAEVLGMHRSSHTAKRAVHRGAAAWAGQRTFSVPLGFMAYEQGMCLTRWPSLHTLTKMQLASSKHLLQLMYVPRKNGPVRLADEFRTKRI